jgi:succinate dehydrogenase hydrophobic anchor subunit
VTHQQPARQRTTARARRGFQSYMRRWSWTLILLLVAAILVIVYSPNVDLPYTTVRSKVTAELFAVAVLLVAVLMLVTLAPGAAHKYFFPVDKESVFPSQDLLRLTCSYLC